MATSFSPKVEPQDRQRVAPVRPARTTSQRPVSHLAQATRHPLVLRGADLLALQQVAGNQAVQRMLARQRQPTTTGPHPIQRLIAVPKSEIDFGTLIDIFQMKQAKPKERVVLYEAAQLDTMAPGEKLYLMGHGYGPMGKFANKDAAVLAQELRARNLRPDTKTIKLLSCQSGTGDGASYAATFAQALQEQWPVTALKGNAVTLPGGKTYAKMAYTKELRKEYKKIIANADTTEAEAIAKGVIGKLGADEQVNERLLLEAAAAIYKKVEHLFKDLYVFAQQKMILPKEQGKYKHPKKTT